METVRSRQVYFLPGIWNGHGTDCTIRTIEAKMHLEPLERRPDRLGRSVEAGAWAEFRSLSGNDPEKGNCLMGDRK